MRFVLHYRGPLRANGKPAHKHELRIVFHEQLKRLWAQPPLSDRCESYLTYPRRRTGDYSLPRPFDPFVFVPLVTEEMNVVAHLSLTLLRPEAPVSLLTKGGDIDNRLKTLFDALSIYRSTKAA